MPKPKIFIAAGEPSGDVLAAELITEIKRTRPSADVFGVVGPKMLAAGARELAHIDQLSVMGFVEVLKQLSYLKRLESILVEDIRRAQPDVVILVDYPGFHLRLAESLRTLPVPIVQYVAPQMWAWGEKRTRRLKAVTDLVLGIMPFEADFFAERAVNYHYVGTPQVDRVLALRAQKQAPLPSLTLPSQPGAKPIIGLFPGSRWGEVTRLLPTLIELNQQLLASYPELTIAISLAPNLPIEVFTPLLGDDLAAAKESIEQDSEWRKGSLWLVRSHSLDLMQRVDAALVTSGTATLECALAGTPMAVAYRMNQLSYRLAKHLVRLPHISLVNLVANDEVIKEFVQEFTANDLKRELEALLFEQGYRQQVLSRLQSLWQTVHGQLAEHAWHCIQEEFHI